MRTSRIAKDTAKVLQALSPPGKRRTRSALTSDALRSFAFSENSPSDISADLPPKQEAQISDDDGSSLSSANTNDIEDLLVPAAKRRKVQDAIPTTSRSTRAASRTTSTRSPRKVTVKQETAKPSSNGTKPRRMPARKVTSTDGSVVVQPPSNWETMYSIVKKMREENPTAPVDTMGCAELYWRASSPRDRRFQTLIALMLSSQTKDTVTAVAMQRLHTELGEQQPVSVASPTIKTEDEEDKGQALAKDSTLNLKNILAVSPERLNELIRTVGFHNNKTKYIKAAAIILRDEYDGDIPDTAEKLMKLPGVGPKMAYLCMSAAWGKHEGIGVDVHVHRITNLWGWQKSKNPEETRMALESWLPKDKWHEINKLLVGLGQTVCLPVGRRCGECELAGKGLCKSEIKGLVPKGNRGIVVGKDESLDQKYFDIHDVKVEKQS
ncbi:DNA repair protein, putative [Paecilomyces variotii No. 5]|uniref:Endonuclease III homolog n=1 Tax=Byssochlamys spectabilis (strain No. 5 / NBRC 109023) TaxID=1356009 RepID=V5FTA8_BYSSN|nr:DNA repair protein, putative [Paecilomyces variotii No. 5]